MDLPKNRASAQPQGEPLRELIERFQKAWDGASASGRIPDLTAFLPPPDDVLRSLALEQLIPLDLAHSWRQGRPIYVEDYLGRFPELKATPPLLAKLLFAEYRARQEHGDKPDASVYQTRFPEQFAELQQQIQEQFYKTQAAPTLPVATPPAEKKGLSGERDRLLPVGEGYRLLKRIGSGSYGEVWRAAAPGGVEVAIKIIFRPIDHEEAQRELQALELIKSLRHPYLVHTQAYWPLEDRLLIIMELADGSLSGRLKECKAAGLMGIPVEELLGYFREAAEALDYLHREHVQHRDIKPDNILLLQRHAKVADFGMARLQGSVRMVNATSCGTPAYMAPEVWQGQISRQSDQYSLAMTYIELRLGRSPYAAKDMVQMMYDHLRNLPDLAPLEEAEQRVILKAVAKEADQRYGSCREFVDALAEALAPKPAPAPVETITTRKSRWLWSLAASGLGLVLGFLAWRLLPHGDSPAAAFTLEAPPAITVATGRSATFPLELQRYGFHEPVTLAFLGLPQGVTITPSRMAGEDVTQQLRVAADSGAHAGLSRITIQAEASNSRQEVTVELAVLFLPPRAEPLGPEIEQDYSERRYFKRIACRLPDDTEPIEFVLVPKQSKEDPDTFYIMKNKVWAGLYQKFVDRQGAALEHPDWQKGKADAREPAFLVSVEDAHRFASLGLHGKLPTTRQWDKAAGLYEPDGREGPYKGSWEGDPRPRIAVARTAPLPVGAAEDDESPFGCRDMAGNGMEWTRDLSGDDRTVPLKDNKEGVRVRLRGQSYLVTEPARYGRFGGAWDYDGTAKDIGFRVVLEP